MSSVEEELESIVKCSERVPTNTPDAWYQQMRTLETDRCRLAFTRSTDSRWVRFHLRFDAAIVSQNPAVPQNNVRYNVFKLGSPSILDRYEELKRSALFLTERVAYPSMPDNFKPVFSKTIEFTFSQGLFAKEHEKVRECFVKLLEEIDNEAELISEDNLARGKLVHLTTVRGSKSEYGDNEYWSLNIEALRSPFMSDHPSEYCGINTSSLVQLNFGL